MSMSDLDNEMRKQGYVPPAEAAKLARVPRSTIYAWIHAGELGEPKRHGLRRIYISVEALRRLAGAVMSEAAA